MNKTFNPLQFIWQLIQLQGELQYNCHHYLCINQSIVIWQLKIRKKHSAKKETLSFIYLK